MVKNRFPQCQVLDIYEHAAHLRELYVIKVENRLRKLEAEVMLSGMYVAAYERLKKLNHDITKGQHERVS